MWNWVAIFYFKKNLCNALIQDMLILKSNQEFSIFSLILIQIKHLSAIVKHSFRNTFGQFLFKHIPSFVLAGRIFLKSFFSSNLFKLCTMLMFYLFCIIQSFIVHIWVFYLIKLDLCLCEFRFFSNN